MKQKWWSSFPIFIWMSVWQWRHWEVYIFFPFTFVKQSFSQSIKVDFSICYILAPFPPSMKRLFESRSLSNSLWKTEYTRQMFNLYLLKFRKCWRSDVLFSSSVMITSQQTVIAMSQHAETVLSKLDKDKEHQVYRVNALCAWTWARVFRFLSSWDWFWSVECWQNVLVSQEAQDHGPETEEQPSLSSSSLHSHSSALSYLTHLSTV